MRSADTSPASLPCVALLRFVEGEWRAGLGKAVRNNIDTHTLSPKGVTLVAEEIREGLTGVVSIFIQEPQFQGQTKDRLNNPDLTSAIDAAVRPALEHWLNHNRSLAEAIVDRHRSCDQRADGEGCLRPFPLHHGAGRRRAGTRRLVFSIG